MALCDRNGALGSARFFVIGAFIAIVMWQMVVLPQHFGFLSSVLREKPEHHLLEQWKAKHQHERIARMHAEQGRHKAEQAVHSARSEGNLSKNAQTMASKPYYDIVALIFSTGSAKDMKRMQLAEKTWLAWHGAYMTNLTMTWVYALCQGDPGTSNCSSSGVCSSINDHAVMLPCPADYARLIGKGVAGYRYVAEHYDFRYVIKADVDSILDAKCTVKRIQQIPKSCTSWGLGLWRATRDSKVFENEPGAGKYKNPVYKKDTGNDYYPPYMTGWAMAWSGDVARFLGMGGLPADGLHSMPKWRDTWTIEDAAIGTFIAGLNLCRLSLRSECSIWTDMTTHNEYHKRDLILTNASEDELVNVIHVKVLPKGEIEDFEGPLKDRISRPRNQHGDVANVQVESIKHCAAKCYLHPFCRAFEFSRNATAKDKESIEFSPNATAGDKERNCQLLSRKGPRDNKAFKNFKLYIRKDI